MKSSNHFWLGIDVAKNFHQAVVVDNHNQQLGESFCFSNNPKGFTELVTELNNLSVLEGNRITAGLESTGNYWQHLARFLKNKGCEIVLVNPIETQKLTKTSIRKIKNDKVDAKRIIQVVKNKKHPIKWMWNEKQIRLKKLTRFAFRLNRQIIFLEEQIINIIDNICPELEKYFPQLFVSKTAVSILEKWPDLRKLDRARNETFTEFLRKKSRGHIKKDKALKILESIRKSIAKDNRDELSELELQMSIQQLRQLKKQFQIIKEKSIVLAKEYYAKEFKYINSVIGVSEFMASVVLAEIGDIHKFDKKEKLIAFAGLDPSIKQSGNFIRKQGNHISKRGSKYLRKQLYHAAQASLMFEPELKEWYDKKKKQGKHHKVCLCAIARKILCRIFVVWKEQKEYVVRENLSS
jgi:transposase